MQKALGMAQTPGGKPASVDLVVIKTHLSRVLAGTHDNRTASLRRWIGRRPQFGDQPQDFLEQAPWHRDLSQLERDVPAVRDDPGANPRLRGDKP